jgi:acid phosphatase
MRSRGVRSARAVFRLAAAFVVAVLAATLIPASVRSAPPDDVAAMRRAVKHVVVIYQENWSFDGLYGSFPGANGVANAAPTTPQRDKVTHALIAALPQPLIHGAPDPNFAAVAGMPVGPYDADRYVRPAQLTGDLVHRYYQEMAQVDGGTMDGFMTWSDNPGLVFSRFDATAMPEGRLAAEYTLGDNGFHSAFGSSFMNHIFFVCACVATFPNVPASDRAVLDATGTRLALDAQGKIVHDGFATPDGFVVNTAFTVNAPHPARAAAAELVPNQTAPTIGDRLSAANVSWKWYSGGWDDALAGNPDREFQFHHQPFAYFASFADGTRAKAEHLQDEKRFFADLRERTLPAVSFIKPIGENNEHPGYAPVLRGQQHVAELVNAVRQSPYWNDTAIVITYDENGGRWDHVPPPKGDRWGPGSRVPFIFVSPWAKRHFIDHTQYESVSVLAFIERLYGLQPLTARDAAANPFSNAFDFTQPPR